MQSVDTFFQTITEAVNELDGSEDLVEEIQTSGEAVVDGVADLEDELTELQGRTGLNQSSVSRHLRRAAPAARGPSL